MNATEWTFLLIAFGFFMALWVTSAKLSEAERDNDELIDIIEKLTKGKGKIIKIDYEENEL